MAISVGAPVGVDTTLLPLRVPATVFMPEMVLVISSDTKSITAVNAATGCRYGNMVWAAFAWDSRYSCEPAICSDA